MNEIEGTPVSSCVPHSRESTSSSQEITDVTQFYDHTPLKWRNLNDVLTQCNLCIVELEKYAETAQDESWLKVMQDELTMIEKNGTWELVDRPTMQPELSGFTKPN